MKRTLLILLVLVPGLALAATAGGTRSLATDVVIKNMSHTHPAGKTYSWVCAKVKKTGSAEGTVTVYGPGLLPGQKLRRTLKGGTSLYRFKINAPGRYTFVARQGSDRDRDRYTVPPPPKPANGPFPCI